MVFFVEQHDFDDPGIDDLINEEPSPVSGTRRARHVGGRRRDTHTAKCEHTVKHYLILFYRYRLACQPGVARAFALRAELRRFAPLAGSAQLSRLAITQARDELWERLLFALAALPGHSRFARLVRVRDVDALSGNTLLFFALVLALKKAS